jgi:type IV pilus assembly protein PilV
MNRDTKMRKELQAPGRERGVMLIEALIAILIFSIGILAVVGMQSVAIKNVTESKHRSEAAFLAEELMAQMWIDQNINAATKLNASNVTVANYSYPGSGSVPARLGTISPPTGWIGRVTTKLAGATTVLPKVTITNPTASGATVKIELFWQLPEEASLGLPPHSHTVIASIQV